MTITDLFPLLDGVSSRGPEKAVARCPAHPDRNASLSIRQAADRVLLHCFAGCQPEEIVAALGREMRDLFTDSPTPRGQGFIPKPQKLDLVEIAYRFELAALDRRLRADRVLQAVGNLNSDELSDWQRDRLMNAVAHAFEDRDRAEFLETVADDFRLKAFHERTEHHAA